MQSNGIHKWAGLLFATSGIKSAVAWFSCVVASWTEGRWEHHHSRRALENHSSHTSNLKAH